MNDVASAIIAASAIVFSRTFQTAIENGAHAIEARLQAQAAVESYISTMEKQIAARDCLKEKSDA